MIMKLSVILEVFREAAMTKVEIFMVVMLLRFVESRRFGVIGGVQTIISESPYQLAFLFNNRLKCGASIISETFGLTAAHCTVQYSVNITVRAGSTFKNEGGIVLKVIKIYNHPVFDRVKLVNDFALLELEKPLKFSVNIQPVQLPDEGEDVEDDTECKISGWGKMDNDEKPTELRSVTVNIVNQDICQQKYNTSEVKFRITSVMLCAGFSEGGRDACQGDSGGGLVCNDILVGDVSSGYGCGLKDFPGIYGRISAPSIRKWIRKISGV